MRARAAGPGGARKVSRASKQAYSSAVDRLSPELEMSEAHVAEGRRHVARQKEIIAELRYGGHPTELAESLLAAFEETLVTHLAHRDRILAEIAAGG